ncbi:MAG: Asp-tRNA(Asn)/Glu-tRNA(Gln) amidotransferase subunit GatC [Actinomycetota bacterium]|nr:Asp-tRNA(Asn)/Glu-tRNA(Gln) amidotransferase subunit GatC [Actinomycetota bacterium]
MQFSDQEAEKFTRQLDKILDHVAKISSADTEDIKPTSHVLDIQNVYREDEPRESLSQKEALKNGPDIMDNGFKVPKID